MSLRRLTADDPPGTKVLIHLRGGDTVKSVTTSWLTPDGEAITCIDINDNPCLKGAHEISVLEEGTDGVPVDEFMRSLLERVSAAMGREIWEDAVDDLEDLREMTERRATLLDRVRKATGAKGWEDAVERIEQADEAWHKAIFDRK